MRNGSTGPQENSAPFKHRNRNQLTAQRKQVAKGKRKEEEEKTSKDFFFEASRFYRCIAFHTFG